MNANDPVRADGLVFLFRFLQLQIRNYGAGLPLSGKNCPSLLALAMASLLPLRTAGETMGTVVSEEAAGAIIPRQTGVEIMNPPGHSTAEGRRTFDPVQFERQHISRLIGAGALLIIGFQIVYLLDGQLTHPDAGPWALALHLFNLTVGVLLLAVSRTEWFGCRWRPVVWSAVVALMASTAGI